VKREEEEDWGKCPALIRSCVMLGRNRLDLLLPRGILPAHRHDGVASAAGRRRRL